MHLYNLYISVHTLAIYYKNAVANLSTPKSIGFDAKNTLGCKKSCNLWQKKTSYAASNSSKDPSICQTLPSCDVSTNTLDEMAFVTDLRFLLNNHASVENGVFPAQWKGKLMKFEMQPPGSA